MATRHAGRARRASSWHCSPTFSSQPLTWWLGPAAAAAKTVPIVFIVGNNPVNRGLVKSLAKTMET